MKAVIRWLGAFAQHHVKHDADALLMALSRELKPSVELAAELVTYPRVGVKSGVGLLHHPDSVKRAFKRDTWSYRRPNGTLRRGRLSEHSDHNEMWLKKGSQPLAIVYKRKYLRNAIISKLKKFGKQNNIPVVEWGQLPAFYKSLGLQDAQYQASW